MVLCRMNLLGLCTVLWLMTIYGVNVCDAECGEYIIVFEETTCHHNNKTMIKPLKLEQINRNNLTYSCSSTDKGQGKKKCLIEFDCLGKQRRCQKHVIPNNFQTHSFIADSHIGTPTVNTTEVVGLPTTAADNNTVTLVESITETGGLRTTAADNNTVTLVESITETSGLRTTAADNNTVTLVESITETSGLRTTAADNNTVTLVESITETSGLRTTAADNNTVTLVESITEAGGLPTTAAGNHTVTRIESQTEASGVINNNITVEQKLHRIVHEVFNPTMYDVNIIYIQSSSERTNETLKPRNQVFQCKYAEIVCKNYSLSNFKNDNGTHHYKHPETLQIEISRDETSTVQPLFTGYFPEASNDSTTNYNDHFQGIMTTSCSIQKSGNCKQNIDSLKYINIYLEANYVQNNTITKYPNCSKDSLTPKNELIVKCEDISFAKHNQHILQGSPTPPQKQEFWNCQITEFKNTSPSEEQRIENNKIHFINCSNKNKSEDINVVPISNIKNLSGMKINKTEISSGKEVTNMDNNSSQINLENIITIFITENSNNCSHNSSLNINEGKIIDLGLNNNRGKRLRNNNVEIILSSCINDHASIINNKQPPLKTELIIILKNESLNTSNLKQFNGTLKDESFKQRILLRCDHTILNVSSNTTSNTTELQCESIDLDLHNITGIEITPSSQITNKKSAIKPENETKQDLATWNCIILEEQQKNKLHFGNCSNDVNINYSENQSGENNFTAISDKTEIPSGKLELNKDNLAKHMIKIAITENVHNCRNNSFLSIDGGKIIDLEEYNNKDEILENNKVELKLSDCINLKSSIINETQADLKDLTIILKTESLNASDLQQFNGTPRERSVKQKILLRCEHSNRDYRINTTSNITVLQCKSIDLDSYNITGIEIITNLTHSSHVNNTKENLKNDEEIDNEIKANANNNFSTNQTARNNDSTVNNNINENKTKEVQKNILESNKNNKTKDENKEIRKNISDSKGYIKNQNFNRRKDIPDGMGQNSLALESGETEKILLIALLSIAGGAILIVIVLRVCTKKKEYNPAPTREPPDEEETAF